MKGIGGNKQMQLQVKSIARNDIGEQIEKWETIQQVTGWLDFQSGDGKYTTYNAKIQEARMYLWLTMCGLRMASQQKPQELLLTANGTTSC